MISSVSWRAGHLTRLAVIAAACAALVVIALAQPVRAQPGAASPDNGSAAWTDVDIGLHSPAAQGTDSLPLHYRLLVLDTTALQAALPQAASMSGPPAAAAAPVEMALPMPQGGFQHFAVETSPVMAPALAAEFPDIQTYRGHGVEDPTATVRLGLTAQGFHAVILSAADTVYITHYGAAGSPLYVSYFASDYPPGETFVCGVRDDEHAVGDSAAANTDAGLRDELSGLRTTLAAGPDLRTYSVAVAATGEYSAAAIAGAGLVNPTEDQKVAAVMATIVTRVNMVNAIYEREVSIHFNLVADNAKLVYLDAATDPYTNNRMDLMLGQNRNNLDAVIGSANYDVGHALGTAGGGIAYVGVACSSTYKGGGVSGAGPADSPYAVMVTAHEMGHQFGAYHTFNANSGACGGGNRSATSAFEPGSGSTIMSYSGLCGTEQSLRGYYTIFHVTSFGLMYDYSRTRNGSNCGASTPTGNHAPVVDAGPDLAIPAHTPFLLSGSASDPDAQPLTYSWQQVDVLASPYTGTATLQQAMTDLGSGALYRVYEFSAGASRSFPALANVLSGTVELGEVYPTTNRTLNFQLFARDNQATGGGANYDNVRLSVLDTGSPFSVTLPAPGTSWPAGLARLVQWNVANTTAAPIACGLVDILLSSDGGAKFSTVLTAATANDGIELVPVPAAPTDHARVLVRCTGSIFYNVSSEFVVRPNTGGGTLSGTVQGTGGAPIAGALVAVSGPDTVAFPTDAAGHYSIQLPTGSYSLVVSAYGHADSSESGVLIDDNAAITRDVTLTALPLRTISGRVTDEGHGYPLYASLEFTKALAPVWTDPLTGYYTVTLVEGYVYTVSADAWTPGFVSYTQTFTPSAGMAELNIALDADPVTCQAPGYSAGTGQCLPLNGGLLVGSTYGPDGAPLAGVSISSGSFVTNSAATADPAVPNAFYSLFLPSGTQVVTATSTGLPAITVAVAMTDESVLPQDFDWHVVYTDASLKQLTASSGTLTPEFSSAVLGYDIAVAADVGSVDLLFTPGQPDAAVNVNGIPQDSDATAATIELRTGTNVVTVVVIALDGVTTRMYRIRIERASWPNYLYLPEVSR